MAVQSYPRSQQRTGRLERREALTFYLCISPWLLGLLLFVLGPMVASLIISFTQWDLLSPARFVGLQNYQKMFNGDPLIWQSLRVTVVYTSVYVPMEMVGGLILALLMNQRLRLFGLFRTVCYLPSVLPGVAFVIVWMWILHPDVGLLNTLLSWVGIQGPRWLADPRWALPALLMMSLWGLGRSMVIYLAGLQSIPQYLYEAAAIDGASGWQSFWKITLPMLSPTVFFNLVLSVISTFQTFTSAFIATDGGPLDATLFYVLYLFRQAFQYFNVGYASAMAWVLFGIIFALTLLIVRSSDRWVYYEGERR
ncbi:MAG: sugar ABC transporter permease [Anaerolineae bacterium]|nr:sugar ABC transporter permease [Anaerolineae bacterium]MDW8067738.1 sugar ABC transporter permease [Anaerolineae bacterium]